MPSEIIVGILSLIGTLTGSITAIMVSNKLTVYRIEQLEKKVNAHNNLVERTYKLEENEQVVLEKLKVINHRIDDLKGEL
ncbi:MAG: hypothetical protein IKL09_03365 [Clostridia bacterium]|nr:hypothetical protein [Clostridia bacterium]